MVLDNQYVYIERAIYQCRWPCFIFMELYTMYLLFEFTSKKEHLITVNSEKEKRITDIIIYLRMINNQVIYAM